MSTSIIATADISVSNSITNMIQTSFPACEITGCFRNAAEIISQVLSLRPDFLFLDLNNTNLSILELLHTLRQEGYCGRILLIGKPTDCLFLRDALSYQIACFLAKPLEASDFIKQFSLCMDDFNREQEAYALQQKYLGLARDELVRRLVSGTLEPDMFSAIPSDLYADVYQIVIYESFKQFMKLPYQLHELLRLAGNGSSSILEYFGDHQTGVILLKGHFALERFQNFLKHYNCPPEKGSPMDSLFLTYGAPVQNISDIHLSYLQAKLLISRRFFCISGQHTLGYDELATIKDRWRELHDEEITTYCCVFSDYLQSFNRRKLSETLASIQEFLYSVQAEITDIKFFLSDLFLQIKENMNRIYSSTNIPFPTNTEIIEFIYRSNYLFEIMDFFNKQFEVIMNAIGNSSRESVFDDILYYIDHNHHTNIKLESIAAIFGYNSAYLGKIFTKNLGESFNSYVDKIRVNHAKELLRENKWKVYEIAEQVGYKNVDYFHKKFKKYVGESPAEYRKHCESATIAS